MPLYNNRHGSRRGAARAGCGLRKGAPPAGCYTGCCTGRRRLKPALAPAPDTRGAGGEEEEGRGFICDREEPREKAQSVRLPPVKRNVCVCVRACVCVCVCVCMRAPERCTPRAHHLIGSPWPRAGAQEAAQSQVRGAWPVADSQRRAYCRLPARPLTSSYRRPLHL
jgi:hypothetical protein